MAGQMATSWERGRGLGAHGGPRLLSRSPTPAWQGPCGWRKCSGLSWLGCWLCEQNEPIHLQFCLLKHARLTQGGGRAAGSPQGQACPTDPWLPALPQPLGARSSAQQSTGCCRPQGSRGAAHRAVATLGAPSSPKGQTRASALGVCSPRAGAEAVRLRGWALDHWTLTALPPRGSTWGQHRPTRQELGAPAPPPTSRARPVCGTTGKLGPEDDLLRPP